MKYRKPLKRAKSRKMFAKGAKAHPLNFRGTPMRGGIRL